MNDQVRAITRDLTDLQGDANLEDVFGATTESTDIRYDDVKHRYWIDGTEVPSVTKVLGETLPKPALTWWGFRVGMSVIPALLAQGTLSAAAVMGIANWQAIIKPADFADDPEVTTNTKGKPKHQLEAYAISARQHPNAIKEDRGTIGTSIHTAAEDALISGSLPDYGDYPEADRGYVQALARWYVQTDPEPIQQEVIVGSARHGFAGRFDLERRGGGDRLVRSDFKTGAGIYPEAHLQLTLYDIASIVMGRPRCDEAELIHLRPDGTYLVHPVALDYQRALVCLLALAYAKDHNAAIKALGGDV